MGCDLGDDAVGDCDVGRSGRGAGAIDEVGVADDEIVHLAIVAVGGPWGKGRARLESLSLNFLSLGLATPATPV